MYAHHCQWIEEFLLHRRAKPCFQSAHWKKWSFWGGRGGSHCQNQSDDDDHIFNHSASTVGQGFDNVYNVIEVNRQFTFENDWHGRASWLKSTANFWLMVRISSSTGSFLIDFRMSSDSILNAGWENLSWIELEITLRASKKQYNSKIPLVNSHQISERG